MRSRAISFSNLGTPGAFNLTPVIDIVFLLIIFFAVVCKFLEAENFPVTVPGGCDSAQNQVESQAAMVTVTVMRTGAGVSEFAVGSEKVFALSYDDVAAKLAGLINERLKTLPADSSVVTLRIDRDVCYGEAQYALAAIAESAARDIRVSVLSEEIAESK